METKLEQSNEIAIVHNEHMQMMPIPQMQEWYNSFVSFTKSILKPDLDFGTIPGTPKPSLYKPGAEKLRFVYGLGAEFETIDKVVDIDRPFIDYTYRCSIKSKTGQIISQCEGNCNSMEAKFGYLWKTLNELPEGTDVSKLPSKTSGKKAFEFGFAIDKAETTGNYGKPKEYWDKWKDAVKSGKAKKTTKKSKAGKEMEGFEMDDTVTVYRILNPDVIGIKNTIMKMAQKRAFVGAILLATGASEFFTQDIEDMEINGHIHTGPIVTEDAKEDAYSIVTDPSDINKDQTKAEPKTEAIPGHWCAKLEKCLTPEDVDNLVTTHKETVNANPELRKLFVQRKHELKQSKTNPLPF